ncbi:uncharacterized protein [Paramormyrops kingsleyae]|uniref:uncharacterized protein isoform X1 n=1 Tax=Paramormyrops kingsleyae TaxID=1676925 RepID=UPI003B97794E
MSWEDKQIVVSTCALIVILCIVNTCRGSNASLATPSAFALRRLYRVSTSIKRNLGGGNTVTDATFGKLVFSRDFKSMHGGRRNGVSLKWIHKEYEHQETSQASTFVNRPGPRNRRQVTGKVFGPYPGSGDTAPGEWSAMRPVVQCKINLMMLTAPGQAYKHLLIDRGNTPPLPFSHLPSSCGYSVKVTWRDVILITPYDGCYIIHQNGTYVLPLLWWGAPVKMVCPDVVPPPHVHLSVRCWLFGMSLHIKAQKHEINNLRIKLKGGWVPSVSVKCAFRADGQSGEVVLYLPYAICDIPLQDGSHTLSVFSEGEHTYSCASLPLPQTFQPPPTAPPVRDPPFYPMIPGPFPPVKPLVQPAAPPPLDIPTMVMSRYNYYPIIPFLSSGSIPGPPLPSIGYPPYNRMVPLFLPYPLPPNPTPGSLTYTTSSYKTPVSTTFMPPIWAPTDPVRPVVSTPERPIWQKLPVPYPVEWPPSAWTTPPPSVTTWVPESPASPPPGPLPVSVGVPTIPPQFQPALMCNTNSMTISLPSARPGSVRVLGRENVWMPLKNAPANCFYKIQATGTRGLRISSPLPACHTRNQSSTSSVVIKFWDALLRRRRILEMRCPLPTSLPTLFPSPPPPPVLQTSFSPAPLLKPQVLCSAKDMHVELPPGPLRAVGLKDGEGAVIRLKDAPKHCGYAINRGKNGVISLMLPFSSCHMSMQGDKYRVDVTYRTANGEEETTLSCPVRLPFTKQECDLSIDKRIPCGSESPPPEECHSRGCCYSSDSGACFYPMDECTVDRHFVFSVPASLTEPPLSPASLFVAGNSSCTPQTVTPNFALFRVPLDGCGAHRYEIGQTVVYMLEIVNTIRSIALSYGAITRDAPLRLLVECRFLPGSQVTVGYLVKTPSLGPSIQAQGLFGVQLRIATDQDYTSYYPQYHRPLHLLLGKVLYLEVRLLNAPDPDVLLLVHYCLAYPRSAQSAWVLIYNGCPNRLDSSPPQLPPPSTLPKHTRRFTITTFQFLSPDSNFILDEEIYFMCSTEVCSPSEGPCVEGCFGGENNSAQRSSFSRSLKTISHQDVTGLALTTKNKTL